MKAFQIHPAPSTNNVVMLAADWTREDRALQPRCAEWLAAAGAIVVIRVERFFEPAKKHFAPADFFGAQSSGRNCVETEYIFPSDHFALHGRFMAVAAAAQV